MKIMLDGTLTFPQLKDNISEDPQKPKQINRERASMNRCPTNEEQQAIQLLKKGNLAGLEILVRHHQVKAVHAAILILHDRLLAEEIVQSAFFQAYQKINQFDETRPFGPWFYRSVINAAIKEAQRHKRTLSVEDALESESASAAGWLLDPESCPEDLVIGAETRQAVWNALKHLKPEQRAVVVMRYFLQMSEKEMTQKLNHPLSTVKWRLYDARQRLVKLLTGTHSDPSKGMEDDHE